MVRLVAQLVLAGLLAIGAGVLIGIGMLWIAGWV